MKKILRFPVIWLLILNMVLAPVHAAGDLSRQEPVEITVELGNEENPMRFYPQDFLPAGPGV